MSNPDRIHILFVCLGNICRSPLAENVFRSMVIQRGLEDRFEIESAGTSAYHIGNPPDSRTVATARGRGVEVVGHSRQLNRDDFERFDYIVAMDEDNLGNIRRLAGSSPGHAQIHLLREWDPEEPGVGVPDPYYGGPRGFDDVHDIVERSCEALLEELLAENFAN